MKVRIFLNRFYNQNKNIIWIIIVVIALFLLFVKTGIKLLSEKNNSSSGNNTTTIVGDRPINNVESNNTIANSTNENNVFEQVATNQEAIKTFISFCNDNKIESAYNMLSDDCKEYLYPNLNDFVKNYYNRFFSSKKEFAISTYSSNIYKVSLSDNSIVTGDIDKHKDVFIDYITVNQDYKISVLGFVKKEELDNIQENQYVRINVKERYVFADYEMYSINIKNLTKADMYIDDVSNSNLYINDEDGNNSELIAEDYIEEDFKVVSDNEKNINLKFKKPYDYESITKSIIFNNIKIINKLIYENSNNQSNIDGDITYNKKMTTYPTNTKIIVDLNK